MGMACTSAAQGNSMGAGILQVYILPTIRINDGQYRGKLSYTEVLRAICAGFTKNAEPKVCMRVSVDDSCRDGSVGQTTCAIRWGSPLQRSVLAGMPRFRSFTTFFHHLKGHRCTLLLLSQRS